MEIYILDSQLRRDSIVETYESMIWTERLRTYGDFQLDIDPSLAEVALFTQGTFIAIDKSDRVMYIDSVENKTQDDGTKKLIIKGKSIEQILENRVNKYDYITTGAIQALPLVLGPELPAKIIRDLVDLICRTATYFSYIADSVTYYPERIPQLQTPVTPIAGQIDEPSVAVTIQSEIDTLYNTVTKISEVYNLGFRLRRVEDATPTNPAKLYFDVYTGFDRTINQTARDAVVFSPELDNLTDTNELTSAAALKNVAYVFATNGSRVVYGNGADSTTAGFQKKVLIVDANDITIVAGSALNAALDQRGQEALSATRTIWAFDGQIPQTSAYVYGVNYMLGDLVEQRNDKGLRNIMKVTEQIFVSDTNGEKSYPTLVLDSLITAGSWDASNPTKNWDGYTTEVWDSM